MYTNHFYERMSERVHKNEKRLSHKEKKKQNSESKQFLNRALKHKVAEYVDTYGVKYIYYFFNDICYKFIFRKNKFITVYEVNIDKEIKKYGFKINYKMRSL